MGVLTGHSASTADFNWSASQICISCLLKFCTVKVVYWYHARPFNGNVG